MFEPPTDEVGITQHHLAAENVTASPFELVPNQSNTGAREPNRRLPRGLESRGLGAQGLGLLRTPFISNRGPRAPPPSAGTGVPRSWGHGAARVGWLRRACCAGESIAVHHRLAEQDKCGGAVRQWWECDGLWWRARSHMVGATGRCGACDGARRGSRRLPLVCRFQRHDPMRRS